MHIQGGKKLPIIQIDWIEGRTREQKAQVVEEITETIVRVAKTVPEKVTIIINDHPRDNIAKSGRLLSEDS